jgi:hypothetical protein
MLINIVLLRSSEVILTPEGQSVKTTDPCGIHAVASAALAASLCAGHAQQLGGESPLTDLMEVRSSDDARATAARQGLKEAWNKRASR